MSFITRTFRTLPMVAGALLLLAIAHGPAQADSNKAWVLESQSGQVHLVRSGISPVSLTDGDVFSGGDWIETGPDGRAVLRRGDETIVVAPGSRIGLPKENTGRFATRILQSLGTILLTVEKQAKQHFEVQTPYLTAVVKGTTFTVGIQGERAVVHVVEGLVEVQNLASGRSSLVRPGQTGSVLRNGPAEVEVQGAADGGKAPSDKTPSTAVPSATQAAAPAIEVARSNNAIAITETLGAKPLDLKGSTRGLIRAAAQVAPQAQLGQGSSKQNGLAVGQVVSVNSGQGNSLALDRSASAAVDGGTGLGLSQSTSVSAGGGTGLGLSQSTSVGAGGSTGLALNQSASVDVGGGSGLGLNLSVDLGVGGGEGLNVDLGLNTNPGENNVVGQAVNTVTSTVSKVGGGLLGGLLGGTEK
jgi:hypothetical protein